MNKNKLKKLVFLLRNPRNVLGVFIDKSGKNLAGLLKDKSFFLQGQMDINSLSIWHKPEFINSTGGFFLKDDKVNRKICDLEPWDNTRRDMIILFLRTIIKNNIDGYIAELGVYKGYTAKLIHKYIPERKLYLFDTFSGFNEKGVEIENKKTKDIIKSEQFSDTSIELVREYIKPNENVYFFQGYFPENLPENFDSMKFSFVHLDADLYDPTLNGLKYFYSKVSVGGIILIHDYNAWIGARTAVDEFFIDKPEIPLPMPDKSGSVLVIKQ